MKPTKENSFLNLSKLSEVQLQDTRSLMGYDIGEIEEYPFFYWDGSEWNQHMIKLYSKQEITYTQFIEMMGVETSSEIETFTLEDLISFGKQCFYSGFEKSEKDDANCFTAWREEASGLLTEFKSKQ